MQQRAPAQFVRYLPLGGVAAADFLDLKYGTFRAHA